MAVDERYVEAVLSLVEQVPAGRATTYGVLADAVGRGGPRQIGRVLAIYGAPVPWWRVVRADGSLPDSHQRAALARYREEGTPLRGSIADATSLRIDLRKALWTPLHLPPAASPSRPCTPAPSSENASPSRPPTPDPYGESASSSQQNAAHRAHQHAKQTPGRSG